MINPSIKVDGVVYGESIYKKSFSIMYDIDQPWKINPLNETYQKDSEKLTERDMYFFKDENGPDGIGCVFRILGQYLKYNYITSDDMYAFIKCKKITAKEFKQLTLVEVKKIPPETMNWFYTLGTTFFGYVGFGYNNFYYDQMENDSDDDDDLFDDEDFLPDE